MSKCNISIDFTTAPEALVAKAREAITGAGGTFNGDAQSGAISLDTPLGAVSGTYAIINGSRMDINIEEKPMFIGCGIIETQLRKYLDRAEKGSS